MPLLKRAAPFDNPIGFSSRREVAEKVGLGFDLCQQMFTSVHKFSDAIALQSV